MSNYLYSSNAVDSLIAYINDVKPFHSKLSEIVEEYQFYENLNVSIDDKTHFTRAKFAGIWDNESYSNGLYAQRLPLPFIKQAKTSKHWNNNYEINPSNIDTQIAGLTTAYYLKHNVGVRKVVKNGIGQIEGIDFHVSHGAHTIKLNGQDQTCVENILEGQVFPSSTALLYTDVKDRNGRVTNIVPNLDATDYEEWTVECIQTTQNNSGDSISYDHDQTVSSPNWHIQHGLNSFDLFTQVYLETPQGLSPISPKQLEFVDSNTMNVKFSASRTGKVKIIRYIDSSQTFSTEVVVPSDVWEIEHKLGSRNLIFSAKMDLNGALEQINPNSIEFVDDNTVRISFSTPKIGRISIGKTDSYTTAVFEQLSPVKNWVFENTLRSSLGIFTAYDDAGNIVFPKNITINSTLIFVEFSRPVAGKLLFVRLFAAGNEGTLFSVSGSESGLIGYAKLGITFNSDKISLRVEPQSDESVFALGEKYVLTPFHTFTSHKNFVGTEEWSIIKVNPIAFDRRPRFSKAGSAVISNFIINSAAIRPQTVTMKFNNGSFDISNSLGEIVGNVAIGATFANSEYAFHISSGTIAPVNGDYFEVEILNPDPYIENLDLTNGYDIDITDASYVDPFNPYLSNNLARPEVTSVYPDGRVVSYDLTEYDDRLINFNMTSLNLQVKSKGIATSYWELKFNGTEFVVTQYDSYNTRNIIGSFPNAQLDVPYDNGEIAFTINSSVVFLKNDVFIFNVQNPEPSFDANDLFLISDRFGAINLYPKSFIYTPTQLWTIEINGDGSFSVQGNTIGQTAPGNVSQSYDNGFIHFTLHQSETVPLSAGDKFFVRVKSEKPSFLVHGSLTGFTKPLTLGKWYWNGKIGLKLDVPQIKIEGYTSDEENVISDKKLTYLLGLSSLESVILDSNLRTITFNRPPRYDAKTDVYQCEIVPEVYKNSQYFKVSSSHFGVRRGAKVGQRYIDDMRVEQSRNLGYSMHDGVVDFTIDDKGVAFESGYKFHFEIVSNWPKLFHGNDLIIFTNPIAVDAALAVEREAVDKIYFKTNSKRAILGVNPADTNNQWFPTYTAPAIPFSDENDSIDVFASISDTKIGTISNTGGATPQYHFIIDEEFFSSFLPFNTLLASKVIQNEQENSIVKARITEKLKVSDLHTIAYRHFFVTNENGELELDPVKADYYQRRLTSEFDFKYLPITSAIGDFYASKELLTRPDGSTYYVPRASELVNVRISESLKITIDSHAPWFHDFINVVIDDKTFRGFFSGYDTNPFDIEANGYDDSDSVQFQTFNASAGGIGYLVQDPGHRNPAASKIGEVVTLYTRLVDDVIGWAEPYGINGLPAIDAEGWNNADVIDGVLPVDAEGWDAAVFNIDYNITPVTSTVYPYDLTAIVSKLTIPMIGTELYGTPYTNAPCALVNVNRLTASVTVMKRGLNVSSVIMYSDLATLTQIPITVTENTSDYIKFDLITPSIGKIVIF